MIQGSCLHHRAVAYQPRDLGATIRTAPAVILPFRSVVAPGAARGHSASGRSADRSPTRWRAGSEAATGLVWQRAVQEKMRRDPEDQDQGSRQRTRRAPGDRMRPSHEGGPLVGRWQMDTGYRCSSSRRAPPEGASSGLPTARPTAAIIAVRRAPSTSP